MRPVLKWVLYALSSLAVAVVALGAVEAGLAWQYHHSESLRYFGPADALREIYRRRRAIIQFTKECARWDSTLSYTLRPGSCRYANEEFETTYRINRAGVRDDEASLDGPEIIVLGDSFAMGWGVEQDETFSQVLERSTGRKVLNAAVSSYATARQMRLLERLDLRRAKLIIVQYCGNDHRENRAFLDGGRQLETIGRKQYQYAVRHQRRRVRRGYRPGEYLRGLFEIDDAQSSWGETVGSATEEARAFLDILTGTERLPSGVPILVFELYTWKRLDTEFVEALDVEIESRGLGHQVHTLHLTGVLEPAHFLVLDQHLNAAGHRRVALAIESRLDRLLGEAAGARLSAP
jgi:lysophospholipase L1-like esterase